LPYTNVRFSIKGMTGFLISPILTELEQVCDRFAIINHVKVARLGTMTELLAEELTVYLTLDDTGPRIMQALEGFAESVAREGRTLTIRVGDEEAIPPIVDRLVAAGAKVYAVAPHKRTLEDVFMEAIGVTGAGVHGLEHE